MDPFGIVLFVCIAGGAALLSLPVRLYVKRQNAQIVGPWREAAAAAGLTEVQDTASRGAIPSALVGVTLTGKRDRFTVSFRRQGTENQTFGTIVTIQGLSPGLTLKLETGATRAARRRGHSDLEIGDLDFDDEVYVEGPGPLVQALMDSAMRLRVRSMLGNDLRVEKGELRAVVPNQYGGLGTGAPLKTVLPLLLEFAERLMRPADLVDRLVANARRDPLPRVRLANLLTLAREFSAHEATRPALQAALADPDDEVRLRAASFLALEGIPVLLALAAGENTDDSCAGRAVTALGEQLPLERTLAILLHALRTRRVATATACLAALGRSRSKDALGTLAKVLARESGPLAKVAAHALGAYGQPEAEAPLVAALDHEASAVRLAAAEALEAGGSVAAVEPLRQAERRHSGDTTFRRAARQAIAAIQSRAGSASPGQLTLAEGESGRLSLEDDAAGHVSLATGKDGPTAARR